MSVLCSLGDEQPCSAQEVYNLDYDSKKLELVFEFPYRSEATLRALGIIPPPTPGTPSVSLGNGDNWGEGSEGGVDTREGHRVGLELVQVDGRGTIESEGSSDGRDDLGNQAVEVGEAGGFIGYLLSIITSANERIPNPKAEMIGG